MAKPVQVTIDCDDPARLAVFWAATLGYEVVAAGQPAIEQALVVDPDGSGPRLLFNRVPEGKVVKNRVHLDVFASGWGTPKEESRLIVEAELQRLLDLGAHLVRTVDKPAEWFAVMQDPEGNEFCVG
jgi:hypothetical protein